MKNQYAQSVNLYASMSSEDINRERPLFCFALRLWWWWPISLPPISPVFCSPSCVCLSRALLPAQVAHHSVETCRQSRASSDMGKSVKTWERQDMGTSRNGNAKTWERQDMGTAFVKISLLLIFLVNTFPLTAAQVGWTHLSLNWTSEWWTPTYIF